MHHNNHIKQYIPIQPTAGNNGSVLYREFFPDVRLQGFIYCYWQLRAVQELPEAYNYNVVADGCMDVFFEMNNPQNSFVMGFSKSSTEFPLEGFFNYIGIRFLPTSFTRLFKVGAAEMSNRFELLHNVVPLLSEFITNTIKDTDSNDDIAVKLNSFFTGLLVNIPDRPDSRFFNAYSLILRHNGMLNVETDLDTGVSPRQLRRMFEHYTGANMKTFSKVVRFQNFLRMAKAPGNTVNGLLYDAGYYDQAHFIKEFKELYGTTPGKVLGK